jgi:uncharacterized protein with GYD domain
MRLWRVAASTLNHHSGGECEMSAAADRPDPRKRKPAVAKPKPPKYVVDAPSLRTPELRDLPCYLLLMKLTEKGAEKVRESHHRYRELQALVGGLGGHVAFFLMTMGPQDYAAAVFLPDDEAAMVLAVSLTEAGYVTTMTMKAFDVVEMFITCGTKPR